MVADNKFLTNRRISLEALMEYKPIKDNVISHFADKPTNRAYQCQFSFPNMFFQFDCFFRLCPFFFFHRIPWFSRLPISIQYLCAALLTPFNNP